MPTYEYHCDACNYEFEEFQYIKDEPLKKCPECGKKKLRRLFGGGAAIVFKGSGFYQTDYRSEKYKSSAKSDACPAAATGSTTACSECPNAKKANSGADSGKLKNPK